jgi:hypothetical protein
VLALDRFTWKSDFGQFLDREPPSRLTLECSDQAALQDARSTAHEKS